MAQGGEHNAHNCVVFRILNLLKIIQQYWQNTLHWDFIDACEHIAYRWYRKYSDNEIL